MVSTKMSGFKQNAMFGYGEEKEEEDLDYIKAPTKKP